MKKYTIIWGRSSDEKIRLIAIDENQYADTENDAKDLGRKLLVELKKSDLTPVGILELDESQIEKLILSDRQVHEIPKANATGPEDDELEFLQFEP